MLTISSVLLLGFPFHIGQPYPTGVAVEERGIVADSVLSYGARVRLLSRMSRDQWHTGFVGRVAGCLVIIVPADGGDYPIIQYSDLLALEVGPPLPTDYAGGTVPDPGEGSWTRVDIEGVRESYGRCGVAVARAPLGRHKPRHRHELLSGRLRPYRMGENRGGGSRPAWT